jgi:hypothetical protein
MLKYQLLQSVLVMLLTFGQVIEPQTRPLKLVESILIEDFTHIGFFFNQDTSALGSLH